MSDIMSVALASIIVFVTLSLYYLILFYPCIKRRRRLIDTITKFLESYTKGTDKDKN